MIDIEKAIQLKEGTIVDVRSPEEFMGGHAADSINIPLYEINDRIDELKSLTEPLLLCCASGNRSGMATQYLTQQGINCVNAGSWLDVNYYQSKTEA